MAENKFTAVDAVPEVVLWPMWDEYSASGIYFKTGNMTEEEKKMDRADICLDNDSTPEELYRRMREVVQFWNFAV